MEWAALLTIFWDKMPDILTVRDVSDAMEISQRSARGLMERIGGMKVAGKWMLAKSKLRAFFEE